MSVPYLGSAVERRDSRHYVRGTQTEVVHCSGACGHWTASLGTRKCDPCWERSRHVSERRGDRRCVLHLRSARVGDLVLVVEPQGCDVCRTIQAKADLGKSE